MPLTSSEIFSFLSGILVEVDGKHVSINPCIRDLLIKGIDQNLERRISGIISRKK